MFTKIIVKNFCSVMLKKKKIVALMMTLNEKKKKKKRNILNGFCLIILTLKIQSAYYL